MKTQTALSITSFIAGLLLLLHSDVNAQVPVLTQHNDLTRSGWNNKETLLKPSNVNVRQFGKIFSVPIDDNMFAQVLIPCNVNIAGGMHNVAVAATVNNTVYAFDAENGNIFWSKNFTPVGLRVVQNTDFAKCQGGINGDIAKNVGIIGTPVIDSITQTLYFVARATDAPITSGIGNYYTYLHAVNIKTGKDKPNSPVLISGSVPGTGPDAVNGLVPFNPQHQNQRLALTLYKGTVFVGFSSHCDWLPYHGWIFGYDAATLSKKLVYNTTPDANGGGIWESGGGIAIDNNGYMYIVTGNGEDGGIGKDGDPLDLSNRAQSAVKLKITDTGLIPIDFFTPSNYKTLNMGADLDYGSMASFLIPNSHFYFTGAKDGYIYMLNTNNMGGFHASGDKISQNLGLGTAVLMRCSPGYYRSQKNEFVYVWSEQSQLKALPFNRSTGKFDIEKLKTGLITADKHSANISTSSNDLKNGTGIVWISRPAPYSSQILSALDADDITKELWNSTQNLKRDSAGGFMKFAVPSVANGKVYLANNTGSVNVYGIVDSTAQLSDCSASTILSTGKPGFASSYTSGHQSSKAFDLDLNTKWITNASSEEWLGVNLGSIDSICNISVQWDSNAHATNFLLQVSKDSVTWKTVKSIKGNQLKYNSYSIKASGKFVKIYCTAGNSQNRYSIKELTVYGRVFASCETPAGLTVNTIDTGSAILRWYPANKATAYTVKFKPRSASVWQSFTISSDSLHVTGLSCDNYYQYVVQSKCIADTSLISQAGEFNTQACENCILPTRTNQADIGDVSIPGHGCFFKPDNYTINGSGTDIGNNADAFHFVYKNFSGNGNVEAQVVALDLIDPLNKAGVMFREDLSADARFVFIGITSSKKVVFINRKLKGGSATTSTTTGYSVPYYVRIAKAGQVFSGYVSSDNKNWDLIGSVTNAMSAADINVGLAVTSHNNDELSNAKFKIFVVSSTGFSARQNLLARSVTDTAAQLQSLKVFPNPANKNFSVNFNSGKPDDAIISIIEIGTGRIIFTENLLNFSGKYHKVFTKTMVPRGTYMISLKTSEGYQAKHFIME